MRRQLQVQPAEGAGPVVERKVALGHASRKTLPVELLRVERPGEAASVVLSQLQVDDRDALDVGARVPHRAALIE